MTVVLLCLAIGLAAVAGVFFALLTVTEGQLKRARAATVKARAERDEALGEADRLMDRLAERMHIEEPFDGGPLSSDLAVLDRMTWTLNDDGTSPC